MVKYSIIIPIYNAEKYLLRCLESIVQQDYLKKKQDVEIILVDDGSTDNSGKVCDEYCCKIKNIIVVHKKNGGVTSARKTACKYIHGKYVIPIDSDDFILSNYISKIDSIIKKNNPDIISFGYTNYKNNIKKVFRPSKKQGFYNIKLLKSKIFPFLFDDEYGNHFEYNLWAKCFRSNIFIDIQSKVSDNIRIGEDALVTRCCIFNAKSLYIDNYAGYNYCYNKYSTINTNNVISFDDIKARICQYKSILKNNSIIYYDGYLRTMIHDIFNAVKSQFYSNNSFFSTAKLCRCFLMEEQINKIIFSNILTKGRLYLAQKLLAYKLLFFIKLISYIY